MFDLPQFPAFVFPAVPTKKGVLEQWKPTNRNKSAHLDMKQMWTSALCAAVDYEVGDKAVHLMYDSYQASLPVH